MGVGFGGWNVWKVWLDEEGQGKGGYTAHGGVQGS